MTIEEEFFKTFGIKPIEKPSFGDIECDECSYEDCDNCGWAIYPEITDRILLELICILNATNGVNCTAYESKNIKDLEKEILNECIEIADDNELKQQVRSLFEVEE